MLPGQSVTRPTEQAHPPEQHPPLKTELWRDLREIKPTQRGCSSCRPERLQEVTVKVVVAFNPDVGPVSKMVTIPDKGPRS